MLFLEKVYSELSFIKNNVLIRNAKNFRKYFVYLTWTKLYVRSIRLECVPPVFYLFRRGIFEKYVSICDEYFCKYFFSDDYIKLTDMIHRENMTKYLFYGVSLYGILLFRRKYKIYSVKSDVVLSKQYWKFWRWNFLKKLKKSYHIVCRHLVLKR